MESVTFYAFLSCHFDVSLKKKNIYPVNFPAQEEMKHDAQHIKEQNVC